MLRYQRLGGGAVAPEWRECRGRERSRDLAVHEESDVAGVVREVAQVELLELGSELAAENAGVLRPHPEADERSNVAEHCVLDLLVELEDILVGEDEPDAVLPKLGEHPGDRQRRERVELVQIDVEGDARGLGDVCPTHPGEPEPADDERAE